MSNSYGVISRNIRNLAVAGRHPETFTSMDDVCHETPEEAFVEAHDIYKHEDDLSAGYRTKIMGIFCVDESGNFTTHLTRNQIIDAIERGEQDLRRVEESEARNGSYYNQHALRVSDVLGRA